MADLDVSAAGRLARLRAAAGEMGIRTFYLRNTSDIAWLTAFDGVFDDERAHALLVTPHDAVLHTDSRYSAAARRAAARESLITINDDRTTHAKFIASVFTARHTPSCHPERSEAQPSAVEGSPRPSTSPRAESAPTPASPTPAAPAPHDIVTGIEDTLTLADFRALEAAFAAAPAAPQLRETSNVVFALRAVKEPAEIARMKAAQAITDAAFAHIIGFMRPGMTERAVQVELEDWMRRHGADGLAFPSIVATGANGASPHAVPGATVLEAGQCVVMDFGAKAHGYCSDMTRTAFLGEPSSRMRDAYAAIRAANEQVEAALRPGVTGAEMHELAEQVLADHGFAGKMGHALGHGVGMDIHEEPLLAPRNKEPLVPGNVVTVEPGVYLDGEFGMRLEDFGAITADGYDVFTGSTHDMVVL